MNKKLFLPTGLIFAFLIQALLLVGASAQPTAQWTFMIYVCGDNDLEAYWPDKNVPELTGVGSTADVHFVALVDLMTLQDGVQLVHIEKGSVTVVEEYSELDLGDPQVAINFVNTAKSLWPAQKYVLDYWNHGGGWDYVCWDQGDDNWLDNPKLAQIHDAVGYIDIVSFDACDMGQIDVYYEFLGHVGYIVGSEESVPGDGYPYDTLAQDLVDNPTWTPERYAIEIVTNYGEYYAAQKGVDYAMLSAFDASQLPAFTTTFTDWTAEMTAALDKYKRKLTSAIRGAKKMWQTFWYVDLGTYLDALLEESIPDSLVTKTQNLKTALGNAIVAKWNGKKMKACQGLTFYWATRTYWIGSWSLRDRYYAEVAWGTATGWAGFLDAYYGL